MTTGKPKRKVWFEYRPDVDLKTKAVQISAASVRVGKIHKSLKKDDTKTI